MVSDKYLSLVVPCYNEGENIYENLLKMIDIVKKFSTNFEIICVNDGSKDNTKEEIEKACKKDKRIRLVSYSKNKGKGHALKVGTEEAKGELISFIDGDLELPPIYIMKYMQMMEEENADVVIASKMHKESRLDYPFTRKVLSLGYYMFLKILFKLKIKDTQTGLKLYKSEIIKQVMPLIETDGFSFDIEVLSIINRMGYKIIDAPIELNFTRGHSMGRIKIKDIFKMFLDTLKIHHKLIIKKHYDKIIKEKNKDLKTIYFFIGTEAELMKMYTVISEAEKRGYNALIVSNGQNIIKNSKYLTLINKKIDIDLSIYAPKKKGMKHYLKWFLKTRRYGIKVFKRERRFKDFKNSVMVVHGDTMSTLMGSMIASRAKLRYLHVESGLRSYNWFSPFPEEIDRYFSSKKSIVNFCQSEQAYLYAKDAFKGEAVNTYYNTGIEILYSALDECKKKKLKAPIKGDYFLLAIHRQENLLSANFMKNVFEKSLELSKDIHCLFIYHDQTKETLVNLGLWDKVVNNKNVTLVPRQDYVNFINIVNHAKFVVGDGCGNQQEFYYLGKPYLIMRTDVENDTEGLNWNALPFGGDFNNITKFYTEYKNYEKEPVKMVKKPSNIIMDKIDEVFKKSKKGD